MRNYGSDREREFFVTGAKTYLDADDAMAEFRRLVQEQCAEVVGERMDEINRACGMGWSKNSLKDYTWPPTRAEHFGKKFLVSELGNQGGLYFCLELLRRGERVAYSAVVYLYRGNKNLAADLWSRLGGSPSDTAYARNSDLIFSRAFPEEGIPDFREHLDRALEDFIAFVSAAGGLKRYLAQTS